MKPLRRRLGFSLCMGVLMVACLLETLGCAPNHTTTITDASDAQRGEITTSFVLDLKNVAVGEAPADVFLLGDFAVALVDGQRVLRLTSRPIDTFGALFGPNVTGDVTVLACVRAEKVGRRLSAYAVGVGGVDGYRLRLAPARRSIELIYFDEVVARHVWRGKPDAWHCMRLQLTAKGDATWQLLGKVWPESEQEPAAWQIKYETDEPPPTGRPSLWGTPYAQRPIDFRDVRCKSVRLPRVKSGR